MPSFKFIHFIVFLGISQGIFLAIAIQVIQNKNKLANKILSLILILVSIMLTGRFFYTVETNVLIFFRLALFVDILVFVFGPLLYVYFRRLIFNEGVKYKLHYSNFIPGLGMLIYHIWTYQYSYEEFVIMVGQGKLTLPFLIVETSGILFNFYFFYRCFQLIKTYKKEEKKNVSYPQYLVTFLTIILIIVMFFLFLWIVSYISYYFLGIYSPIVSYNAIWIAICVFIYVIGFYSLWQPDIFRMPIPNTANIKNKERIRGKALQDLAESLEHVMTNEKIYLNHKLTLLDLAKRLDTSANNLSWLLNNVHKSNFYDYINKYRVQEFMEKVQNGEHRNQTLLALSLDAGFNSKSTFNKTFKAVMNDTPSNYIKKLSVI